MKTKLVSIVFCILTIVLFSCEKKEEAIIDGGWHSYEGTIFHIVDSEGRNMLDPLYPNPIEVKSVSAFDELGNAITIGNNQQANINPSLPPIIFPSISTKITYVQLAETYEEKQPMLLNLYLREKLDSHYLNKSGHLFTRTVIIKWSDESTDTLEVDFNGEGGYTFGDITRNAEKLKVEMYNSYPYSGTKIFTLLK